MYSMQAIDGKMYWADPRTGTVQPVMHNGEHLNATPNTQNVGFSAADKQIWDTLNAEAKDIQNEINRLEKRYKDEYREDEKQKLNTQIAELREKLAQNRQQAMDFITGRRGQTTNSSGGVQNTPTADNNISQVYAGMDIGANMLGVRKATITTHFNAPRKKKDGSPYNHAGVDYAMTKDTPIRLDDVGTVMRVTNVANQPNGYGNYVDIEGELTDKDGKKHKIGMRFAHMGNGTVSVKKGQELRYGDLIGKVGNTGNSRGKNGGYHLHLETTIDGRRVDPTTFKGLISQYVAHSKTLKPNTYTGLNPDVTPFDIRRVSLDGRKQETTLAYRNPKTGDEISQSEVEELRHKYANNPEELRNKLKELEDNGYVPAESGGSITPSQPSNNGTKFPITETPTVQVMPSVDPLDMSPSYMRVNLPPTRKGTALINPSSSISFVSPHFASTPSDNNNTSTEQAGLVTPSVEENVEIQKAIAELNDEYNTWDEAFRNRYQFGSMSDFWRV